MIDAVNTWLEYEQSAWNHRSQVLWGSQISGCYDLGRWVWRAASHCVGVGVSCHCSHVWLYNPVDCSPWWPSVHAVPSRLRPAPPRGTFPPWDWACVLSSCTGRQSLLSPVAPEVPLTPGMTCGQCRSQARNVFTQKWQKYYFIKFEDVRAFFLIVRSFICRIRRQKERREAQRNGQTKTKINK